MSPLLGLTITNDILLSTNREKNPFLLYPSLPIPIHSFFIRLYQSLYFCTNLILLTILKPTLSSHCPSFTFQRRTLTIHRYCQRVQCHRLTVATFTNVANKLQLQLQLQLPASWSLHAVMLLLWNISLVCS
jgi:hypothetical protein